MATDILDPNSSPNSGDSIGENNVRRLNKLPLIFIGIALALVLAGILYALNSRKASSTAEIEAKRGNNTIGNNEMVNKLLGGVGDGIVDSTPGETIVIDNTREIPSSEPEGANIGMPDTLPQEQPQTKNEEAERIAAMVRDFRQRNFYDAIIARTVTEDQPNYDDQKRSDNGQTRQIPTSSNPQLATLLSSLSSQGISSQNGMESLLGDRDPNLRLRKDSFVSNEDNPYSYSTSVRTSQLTPYEVRVGTIIPAVMVSGINSDLPGEIIAQVSQDIRDTKTGRFVLIPQGSKLIGRYDSHIAMGQERVLIAWHRLQFPDASVFNLGNMGAVDLAGYAGMHDQVNNHTWRIFKNAFLLSVIGAGAQIAIGDGGSDEKSPINTAKSELGRQFGQVGTEMIKRNMNVQPTLEIRPGYRFNVMVNKDLILSPYQSY